MGLQCAMARLVEGRGGGDFMTWRAFRDRGREGEGPERFVDGEMVERFADLRVEEVVGMGGLEGMGMDGVGGRDLGGLRDLVGGLRLLH